MDKEPKLITSGSAVAQSGLRFRIRPGSGEPPYPTVLMLHGRSGSEDAMWIFERALPKHWLVVAPRAPKIDPQGGYSWHIQEKDEWPPMEAFSEGVERIQKLTKALAESWNADLSQLYLMGFSQGAAVAFTLASLDRESIKGVAALFGFIPCDCAYYVAEKAAAGLPVFLASGERDPLVPAELTEAAAMTLRGAGARLEHHAYDTGHKLNAQGMRDLKLWWSQLEK